MYIGQTTGVGSAVPSVVVGPVLSETSSLYYDGTLLPVGTTNRLKNKGKDGASANLLVNSGQGKLFNGSNQYVNTGVIPNASQGTIGARFTYGGIANKYIVSTHNSSTAVCSIGVDSNGKIIGRLGTSQTYLTSNVTAVSGTSYKVDLTWIGTVGYLYIDGALSATSAFTANTVTTYPLFIGARNLGGTADGFHNNIIKDVSIYNVALTDAQILSLYQYPEKITTNTLGGIVPDIGNVDNCVFYAPMSESNGYSVVDVSKPLGSELAVNGGFDDTSRWTLNSATIGSGACSINAGNYVNTVRDLAFVASVIGKTYKITFDITAYTSGTLRPVYGGANGAEQSGAGAKTIFITALSSGVGFTLGSVASGFVGSIDNISVKEIPAYPIANGTDACATSAKQLAYGSQTIAWRRDTLGLPLGMSKFIHNPVSLPKNTTFIPNPSESFAIEMIVYVQSPIGVMLNGVNSGCRFSMGYSTGKIALYHPAGSIFSAVLAEGYHRVIANYDSSTKLLKVYFDSGSTSSNVDLSGWTIPANYSFAIGAERSGASNYGFYYILNTPHFRLHKGAQYAKFDPVKADAKMVKIIATLP